jgi:hypothetical protein
VEALEREETTQRPRIVQLLDLIEASVPCGKPLTDPTPSV